MSHNGATSHVKHIESHTASSLSHSSSSTLKSQEHVSLNPNVSVSQDVTSSTSSPDSRLRCDESIWKSPTEIGNQQKEAFTDNEYSVSFSGRDLPSIESALSSLNNSLDQMSQCLDSYEENMNELSKLQDLSDTFNSLDSSLNSLLSDELEIELDELDSSFSSISSFDSSSGSFIYETLKASPTVHHQVKFSHYLSLELLSTEKLLPETDATATPLITEPDARKQFITPLDEQVLEDPVPLSSDVTLPSDKSSPLNSAEFSTPYRKSAAYDRKSFPCDRQFSPLANNSALYPKASTPVSKLMPGEATSLSVYRPRTLFKQFSSSSSLESGCDSQDSGYKSHKLSLSSNIHSCPLNSMEKGALVGKCHITVRSPSSSTEFSSAQSYSYEEVSSFTEGVPLFDRSIGYSIPSSTNQRCRPKIPPFISSPEKAMR